MPLIIVDLRTSKIFCPENDDQDWSVGEKFVYLTKFLQSEDVEVINLSAAPENVGVIAYFQSTDWVARAEELIAGRSNWGTPMNPIPRTRIADPYPDKDIMDIVQPTVTIENVDDRNKPIGFRGNADNVSWPSSLVNLAEFLLKEEATILSLSVTRKQLVLVTGFGKEGWLDRLWMGEDRVFQRD
jgi:hypothetical protein